MTRKRRKRSTNTILITAVISALIAAILIVTGIILLTEKAHKPREKEEAPGRVTITKPLVEGEELLIKGCLFDLGIPKDHVRIKGRTVEVSLSKAPVPSSIEEAFAAMNEVKGVEIRTPEPSRLTLIINEKEWNIYFRVSKAPERKMEKVAIIIDDMGQDMDVTRRLCAIDANLTFSVLPYETHTEQVALYLHKQGKEVLLHLPMEGNGKNPGLGAIYHDTNPEEARKILKESLEKVPMADGVNNHMGSVVTQNEAIMKALFADIKDHGLFFIDSLTTGKSICASVATEMNLPFQVRDVFLDNEQSYPYIARQLDELVTIARRHGQAIAICHPHPVTVEVLVHEVPRLNEKGIEVVRASRLIHGRF
ncbi:MAG TPA: divergent polysaccharide deacetylase family protein [Desulfomonilia bacterium]|nr:divergent polysaccharide deacetylase family protein [Desulfomonilia bacterium]